jgi:tetrahydromethanopterin S-methyltransferase subunit A
MKTPVTLAQDVRIVQGQYHPIKDWVKDKKGYFLVQANEKKGLIELGFCKKENIVEVIIQGKTPQEVYFAAIKEKLVTRLDHAAYLGKELEKAYLALKNNLKYVQDDELEIKK